MSVVAHELAVRLGTGRDAPTVVGPLDLVVEPGEWVTLVGPNGAGKSTLLRALAGLVDHGGTIRVDGADTRTLGVRQRARRVALVPQLPVVPPGVSVADYVALGRTPHLGPLQREGVQDRAVVARTLADLELVDVADRPLTTMSGGELQRVFLARALAQQPAVLLLDEPTSALDLGHQQTVLELVDRLRTGGLTVVTTMHDLTLAGEYADRLVLLDRGRVVAAGPPAEVLTAGVLTDLYAARLRVVPAGTWPDQRGPVVVPLRPDP